MEKSKEVLELEENIRVLHDKVECLHAENGRAKKSKQKVIRDCRQSCTLTLHPALVKGFVGNK